MFAAAFQIVLNLSGRGVKPDNRESVPAPQKPRLRGGIWAGKGSGVKENLA